jgi:hypothetical protein
MDFMEWAARLVDAGVNVSADFVRSAVSRRESLKKWKGQPPFSRAGDALR